LGKNAVSAISAAVLELRTSVDRDRFSAWPLRRSRNALCVDFNLASESGRILELTRQYRNVPMSLADACLVRMSEQHPQSLLLTLDSDFNIYRRFGREPIPLSTETAR
jgi:hypothetical protein